MRNPTKEEMEQLNAAAIVVARAQLSQNQLLVDVSAACGVPPGTPLDLGRGCWLQVPMQQGAEPLEVG